MALNRVATQDLLAPQFWQHLAGEAVVRFGQRVWVRVARPRHHYDPLEPKPEQLAQSLRAAVGGPYDGEAI